MFNDKLLILIDNFYAMAHSIRIFLYPANAFSLFLVLTFLCKILHMDRLEQWVTKNGSVFGSLCWRGRDFLFCFLYSLFSLLPNFFSLTHFIPRLLFSLFFISPSVDFTKTDPTKVFRVLGQKIYSAPFVKR